MKNNRMDWRAWTDLTATLRFVGVRLLIAVGLLLPIAVRAGDPILEIQIRPLSDLATRVEALPRVKAGPGTPMVDPVNDALDAANARIKMRVEGCRAVGAVGSADGGWRRQVAVTMRGPRYLSLVVQDDWQCGRSTPDIRQFATVYDLTTGKLVDWKGLLPASWVQRVIADTSVDGTSISLIGGKGLSALYIKMVVAQTGRECEQILNAQELSFLVWPEGESSGLTVLPWSMPVLAQVCGRAINLGMGALRKLGVSNDLLNSIEASRRERWYGME